MLTKAIGRELRALGQGILINLDTWRTLHLGCYGYPRATSPNLDRFAAESTLFENAPAGAIRCQQ